jgi:3D (Asp-Asp-Asp) domain-containing protein
LQTVQPTRVPNSQVRLEEEVLAELCSRSPVPTTTEDTTATKRPAGRWRPAAYVTVATLFAASVLSYPFAAASAQQLADASKSTTTTPNEAAPAIQVTLIDGAKAPQAVKCGQGTVQQALTTLGISTTSLDRVTPSLSSPVTPSTTITVTHVRVVEEHETAPIPFKTVFTMSSAVPAGSIGHGHQGVNGVLTKTFLAHYTNDHLDSRHLISKVVTKKPVNQETVGGIRTRMAAALPSRSGSYHRLRAITMTATGYSPYEGSGSGRCATGMRAGYGVVAVDPRVIRLGTRLYVEGYGYAVAGDTGGAIKGRRIDLGHTTRREAMNVGRRSVKVWVLDSGN